MIENSSPRTRGCSLTFLSSASSCLLFPAHAGVFPMVTRSRASLHPLPRARGGVPRSIWLIVVSPFSSPRTRGCSHSVPRNVRRQRLESHSRNPHEQTRRSSPRTRGCSPAGCGPAGCGPQAQSPQSGGTDLSSDTRCTPRSRRTGAARAAGGSCVSRCAGGLRAARSQRYDYP